MLKLKINNRYHDSLYDLDAEISLIDGVEKCTMDIENKTVEIVLEKNADQSKLEKQICKYGNIEGKKIKEDELADSIHEIEYEVDGMHCASCELILEKKLIKLEYVKSIDASANDNRIIIEYVGNKPSIKNLNSLFQAEGYTFKETSLVQSDENSSKAVKYEDGKIILSKNKIKDFATVAIVSMILMGGFLALHNSGLSALISVNSKSSLPMFMVFGLLAGFSSCAALVGGVVLSMSKQWMENFSGNETFMERSKPHLLFNLGRLASYAFFGLLLGLIGNAFQFSLGFTSTLVLAVSVLMLFMGLQMLGVRYFQKFQITMPRFVTRYVADEKNFSGKYMPILMGAGTFFLPCGFTITAQGLALTSGNAFQGMLIMTFFAIGTLPALLSIGLSSVAFQKNNHMANRFLKTAGVLVIFFAVFNANAQLNVLGYSSLSDISFGESTLTASADEIDGLPPIVNGKQVLKMNAQSFGYEPNKLKVRKGIPVKWEITDKGTSGCTNAVMSKGLFDGQIDLIPGQVSIKEFTPEEVGRFKFSCWMGMVSGTIDVVDVSNSGEIIAPEPQAEPVSSGAKGCGCGGGGSGTCGGN